MGDVRYEEVYERLAEAPDRRGVLSHLADDEVIAALAAASHHQDALLANVLATEAQNRVARLGRLLAAMGEAVLVVRWPDLTIEAANPAAERILGYGPEELRGESPRMLHLSDEGFETFTKRVRESIASGQTFHTEYQLRRRDGSRFPSENTVAPILDRSGNTVGLLSLIRDLSGRRRAERRMAAQNAVARVLAGAGGFDNAVVAVLEAFCENLGWELGEAWWFDPRRDVLVLEQTWEAAPEATGEFVARSHQMTFARGEGLPGRTWETLQATGFPDLRTEPAFVRRASARQLGFRSAFGLPILTGHRLVGVLTFLSQEPHTFDEELREVMNSIGRQLGQFVVRSEAETLARSLVDAGPDATIVIDREARVVSWSQRAEELFGVPRRNMVGEFVDRVIARRSIPDFHAYYEMVYRGEAPPSPLAEFFLRRGNGTEFPAEVAFHSLRTRAGWLVAAAVRDATARRAAEARDAELAAIVYASPDAIVSMDLRGVIVSWNPGAAQMYGYSGQEAVGRPIGLIVPPEKEDELDGFLLRVRAGEFVGERTTLRRKRGGELIEVSLTLSPIRDRMGRVVGAASVARPV